MQSLISLLGREGFPYETALNANCVAFSLCGQVGGLTLSEILDDVRERENGPYTAQKIQK